jgi:hypothetical protein
VGIFLDVVRLKTSLLFTTRSDFAETDLAKYKLSPEPNDTSKAEGGISIGAQEAKK